MTQQRANTIHLVVQIATTAVLTFIGIILSMLLTQVSGLSDDVKELNQTVNAVQVKVASEYLTKADAEITYQRKAQQ